MKQPDVTVERDAAMRGWEVNVFREDGESSVTARILRGEVFSRSEVCS